jgi:hypothetical protein
MEFSNFQRKSPKPKKSFQKNSKIQKFQNSKNVEKLQKKFAQFSRISRKFSHSLAPERTARLRQRHFPRLCELVVGAEALFVTPLASVALRNNRIIS